MSHLPASHRLALVFLARWERASDLVVLHASPSRLTVMESAWSDLIEWLDHADLNGSSYDPSSDAYLPAVK